MMLGHRGGGAGGAHRPINRDASLIVNSTINKVNTMHSSPWHSRDIVRLGRLEKG